MDLIRPLVEWTDSGCRQTALPSELIYVSVPLLSHTDSRASTCMADNLALRECYVCNRYVMGGQKVKYMFCIVGNRK